MPRKASKEPLIFILGIMPRSGTNFLSNLLQLHPECVPTEKVWEDYCVAHAHLLTGYSEAVTAHWDPAWGIGSKTADSFNIALGNGIGEFLHSGEDHRRTIAKTPSVQNLHLFFRFFPDSPLLILVRDGRSIIESGVRSFGWRYESALHWLVREARTIVEFIDQYPPQNHRYRIMRYEDLWSQPEEQVRKLLDFLGLDPQHYDFEQARQLPVRGSSEILENDRVELHWDPLDKTEDFDPLSRHRQWTDFMNYRYQQIAGSTMASLGYQRAYDGPVHLSWKLRSLFLDGLWLLKKPLRPIYKKLFRQQAWR